MNLINQFLSPRIHMAGAADDKYTVINLTKKTCESWQHSTLQH